jgi:NTE family protein
LGLSVEECIQLAHSLDISRLCAPNPATFVASIGLDDGANLRNTLLHLVHEKTGTSDPTFLQLKELTGMNLCVGTTDVERSSVDYLATNTDPSVSVISAVMASMALPPLFSPIKLADGRLLSDGGLLDNFPIHLFPADQVLGMRITSEGSDNISTKLGYLGRVARIISVPLDEVEWACTPNEYKARTISIEMKGTSFSDLSVDERTRNNLIEQGCKQTQLALQCWARFQCCPASFSSRALMGLPPNLRRWFTPLLHKESELPKEDK